MPIAFLKRNPSTVSDEQVRALRDGLRPIIAVALDVPDNPKCRLTIDDVDVEISDDHPLNTSERDYGIIVIANAYEERMRDLDKRTSRIATAISQIPGISGLKGYVYVTPTAGEYQSIPSYNPFEDED